MAYGLPWCKNEPATIGLASATSKILCGRHNQALSPFDAEAAKFSQFITTNVVDEPLSRGETTLSGPLLEKWAVKTLFNLGFIGALDRGVSRLIPAPELVRVLFSSRSLEDGAGLYFVSGGVSNDGFKVGLAWWAIANRTTGKPTGMMFTFNGVRLAVTIVGMRAETQLRGLGHAHGVDYAGATIIYRPPNIVMTSETAGRKLVNLQW